MKKIIITADDYGVFPSVNKGIIDAVQKGKVNSVAVLPNYRNTLANTQLLLQQTDGKAEIGCHLTFTSGKPLTFDSNPKIKDFCQNGYFADYTEMKYYKDCGAPDRKRPAPCRTPGH